jgi:uncharacterized membrane protein YsdA (DUF1294 family)
MTTAIVAAVVVSLNAATWAAYRIDKARAGTGVRRIPERTLLGLAVAGGSLGALIAMYAHRHRHKTRKLAFATRLWAIVAVHAGLMAYAVYAATAT